MNAVLKAGIGLAVIVEIITVIGIASGMLLANRLVAELVLMVIFFGLTGVAIFWGLGQTAAESGYGKQLLNALLIGLVAGVLIGLVAGVLIFAFSMLNLTVLFPDYLAESKTASIEVMENMSMPEQRLEAQVAKIEAQTVAGQARSGARRTIMTSLFLGAIIAIFKRRK